MDATLALPILIGLIAVALLFDFLNGLHDAANSIATIVSTRVLPPQYAVALGGVLQLHRLPVLRPACRQHHRHGHHRRRASSTAGDLRGADRRHRLEPDHLVARHSLVEFARADRRAGRRGHRQGRDFGGWSGPACPRRCWPSCCRRWSASCWRWCWSRSCPGCRCARRRSRWIAPSASCSSSRPRSIRSAMAATTRRRPWASSPCCCISQGHLGSGLPRAVLGGAHLPGGDGAGHADGRLAHRAHHGLCASPS